MIVQNQIKRKLTSNDAIDNIRKIQEEEKFTTLSRLAERLCEEYNFYNLQGNKQRAGCIKALKDLERAGYFNLPTKQKKAGIKSPRRLSSAVTEPVGVPKTAGAVEGLELILVDREARMRIWNELMIQEHPRGQLYRS